MCVILLFAVQHAMGTVRCNEVTFSMQYRITTPLKCPAASLLPLRGPGAYFCPGGPMAGDRGMPPFLPAAQIERTLPRGPPGTCSRLAQARAALRGEPPRRPLPSHSSSLSPPECAARSSRPPSFSP